MRALIKITNKRSTVSLSSAVAEARLWNSTLGIVWYNESSRHLPTMMLYAACL